MNKLYLLWIAFFVTTHARGSLQSALNQLRDSLSQLSIAITKPKEETFAYQTLDDWYTTCAALPYYIQNNKAQTFDPRPKAEKLDMPEITKTLKLFAQATYAGLSNAQWVANQKSDPSFFNIETTSFNPYAQKLILPTDTQIAFHGDLHGDIHSVMEFLKDLKQQGIMDENFKIIKENFYIIFLGDYVDRGIYGLEVLYTIMRLKIANPTNCYMVRGNHEYFQLNMRYGFADELQKKLPGADFSLIYNMYNLLPVVLYVGCINQNGITHYLQCCHGGIEIGYLPHQLFITGESLSCEWIGNLNQANNLEKIIDNLELFKDAEIGEYTTENEYAYTYGKMKYENFEKKISKAQEQEPIQVWKDFIRNDLNEVNNTVKKLAQKGYFPLPFENRKPTDPTMIGFLWNDFSLNPFDIISIDRGRSWLFGRWLTNASLRTCSMAGKHHLVGIFRAHQHTDLMMRNSIYKNGTILLGPIPGVSCIWKKTTEIKRLWQGIVATFNVCPDTIYSFNFDYSFDTYGILKLGKQFPDDWRLDIFTKEKSLYNQPNSRYTLR